MTRNYPMKPGVAGEAEDHPHHRSLWFTHGDVNGVSFWHEGPDAGKIVHAELVEARGGKGRTEMNQQAPKRIRRTQYLVNRRLQIHITLQLMAVMAAMGVLYTVGLHILPGSSMDSLEGPEMRSFLTSATAIYFGPLSR